MPIKKILKEMPIEEALVELEKCVTFIANIGDIKSYIDTNREDFIYIWAKVNQYYKYVIYNTDKLSEEGFRAIGLISDLVALNPSLGQWVDLMIEPKRKGQNTVTNGTKMDVNGVREYVEAIAYEVKNMPQWDIERVRDVQIQLQEYQKMIMANKALFEVNIYQNIMDNISSSLDKIERYCKVIYSNPNEHKRILKPKEI